MKKCEICNMKNDELEEKIKEIFLEEYRKDIGVTWDKYIPSGKLGLTISIADDGDGGKPAQPFPELAYGD